ncbi:metallophosphoesterase [Halosimplex pelagicum]|uniref:Phosphoesterase n=1 Tax=Halosimplex pelagicum TaxID=869886 RepID=A0A7D5P4S2_9EURY|nr:metallophosphoesterase [Halosimplex pelagicum]QLH80817.1 metallophosphoesterase [Halosimplex pelagicum]
MITVVSDTHGTDGHRLEGRTLEAVREAELVIHAGDFTTEAVLDAFEAEAGSEHGGESERAGREGDGAFVAVYGNNDGPEVRGRLTAERTVEHGGVRFVVVHGHEHDDTSLSLLGRQERADVVVVGHSHEPGRRRVGAVTVLNPGSHADPRWSRPGHAELEPTGEGPTGRLVAPDGEVFDEFDLAATERE